MQTTYQKVSLDGIGNFGGQPCALLTCLPPDDPEALTKLSRSRAEHHPTRHLVGPARGTGEIGRDVVENPFPACLVASGGAVETGPAVRLLLGPVAIEKDSATGETLAEQSDTLDVEDEPEGRKVIHDVVSL
jgi:hypothetical protein